MKSNLAPQLDSRNAEAEFDREDDREDDLEFLMPGYNAGKDTCERLKESHCRGFAFSKFDGEDWHRAAHLVAHMLNEPGVFYHQFGDFLHVLGSEDPELLNNASNDLVRIGVIRLDVSSRRGAEELTFVLNPDFRLGDFHQ